MRSDAEQIAPLRLGMLADGLHDHDARRGRQANPLHPKASAA